MSLQRVGATYLFAQRIPALHGRILDLGAGEDPYQKMLGGDVVSLDVTAEHRPDVVGDAHALPFGSETFDAAVASQVFEHLSDPFGAATELARVLRPGGKAVVAVPFLYWLHQRPHDYYRYTEYGLRRVFEPDFDVVELVGYGGKLVSAIEMLCTATPSSSWPRRALRQARKVIFGAGVDRPRPLVARLLLRRPGDHPIGYVVVLRRRADVDTRP